MKPKIELVNVSKSFASETGRIDIFININLSVTPGEIVGILGPNGCGKTTLLNLINHVDSDYSGNIRVRTDSIDRPAFAYMMQKDLLLPWRTVYQNIILGLEIQNRVSADTRKTVLEYLEMFNMSNLVDVYPTTLSGGEKQKVALIRTLIVESEILLLDEPFSSIDYHTRLELQQKIYSFVKERKVTAVLITHDIDEAISVCDRIIILDRKPKGIIKTFDIRLDTADRTPMATRKHKTYPSYFSDIWKSTAN